MPPRRAPRLIASLAFLSDPDSKAVFRFLITRLIPSSAAASVIGFAKEERYASVLWHRASMPVAAVTGGGMLIVNSGSTTATEGSKRGLLIHCFFPSTVTIEVTVSSAPVPAVVGSMMEFKGFLRNFSFPTNDIAGPSLVAKPAA